MPGTIYGGKNAATTNKERYDREYLKKYGMTFYQYIGHKGGQKGHTGGFTDRNLARRAGRLGGLKSRKGPKGE